eukprot:m.4680 g.4680  ORF g.4680 m.4680 type:complete len:431 (+) comp3057_c0_seq2:183-1475(+)
MDPFRLVMMFLFGFMTGGAVVGLIFFNSASNEHSQRLKQIHSHIDAFMEAADHQHSLHESITSAGNMSPNPTVKKGAVLDDFGDDLIENDFGETIPKHDQLTKILRKVASKDKMVVATSTDYGYLSITKNWICHMKKLGLEKQVVVFSLDKKIHEAVREEGIYSYFEPEMSKSGETVGVWNSKSYNQVVHTKTKHQHAILKRGFDLFFTDIDIPWTIDWRPIIAKATPENVEFNGQQNWPQNDMNVGFFFARSTTTMLTFFENVLKLEDLLEKRIIPLGNDPRKDIFDPSDDQSAIAFSLLCGFPNGSYPGRGNFDAPKGGHPAKDAGIEVQPHWQRRMLFKYHSLTNRKLKHHLSTRVFDANCQDTTGLKFKYGLLPPLYFQTGHKDYKRYQMDAILFTNMTTLYHPNFMKGKDKKIDSLTNYKRWLEC